MAKQSKTKQNQKKRYYIDIKHTKKGITKAKSNIDEAGDFDLYIVVDLLGKFLEEKEAKDIEKWADDFINVRTK